MITTDPETFELFPAHSAALYQNPQPEELFWPPPESQQDKMHARPQTSEKVVTKLQSE